MELKDFVRIIRARVWLILGSAVVVLAASIGYGYLQSPTYTATTELVISEQNASIAILGLQPEGSNSGRDDVMTQAQVIGSARIARQVIATLHLSTTPELLLQQISTSADSGTNIITIQASDESPVEAARLANAFADAYIAWSQDNQRSSIRAAILDLERRLAETQSQIAELSASSGTAAGQAKLQAARDLYASLSDNLEQLRIAEQLSTGKGAMLTTATVPPAKTASSPLRKYLPVGLALGLLVGLALAFGAERMDTHVESVDEIAEISGLTTLANIPMQKDREEGPGLLAAVRSSNNAEGQAFRMLRNSLDFLRIDDSIRTLLITSAAQGEGKSTVAANLAVVFSQAGKKVYLVACDFWLPGAERFFELQGKPGLADILAGTATLGSASYTPPDLPNLAVIPPGSTPVNPSELLASQAMGDLIKSMHASSDVVIIDSAPVLATADAAAAVRWADGVLLVARVGVTERKALRSAGLYLANVGARLLGSAVLAPQENIAAAGYYSYHYTKGGPS